MCLPYLAARIIGTPLLIAPEMLGIILVILGERIGWPERGLKPRPFEAGRIRPSSPQSGHTAVIPR